MLLHSAKKIQHKNVHLLLNKQQCCYYRVAKLAIYEEHPFSNGTLVAKDKLYRLRIRFWPRTLIYFCILLIEWCLNFKQYGLLLKSSYFPSFFTSTILKCPHLNHYQGLLTLFWHCTIKFRIYAQFTVDHNTHEIQCIRISTAEYFKVSFLRRKDQRNRYIILSDIFLTESIIEFRNSTVLMNLK